MRLSRIRTLTLPQDSLGPCLADAPSLRAIHVNRPLDFGSEDVPRQSYDQILEIARQCRPSVKQFGLNTRVFQVRRLDPP